MPTNNFFESARQQSLVKAAIVSQYFITWSKVMMATQNRHPQYGKKLMYLDLFAGPGRYEDGTTSTPLMVLEQTIADPELRQRLVTVFNDKDERNVDSLQVAINGLSEIETLRYAPQIQRREVGTEMVKLFESISMVPTFFFVDPGAIDQVLKMV